MSWRAPFRRPWRKPAPLFTITAALPLIRKIRHDTLWHAFPWDAAPAVRLHWRHRLQGDINRTARARAYAVRAWLNAQRERRPGRPTKSFRSVRGHAQLWCRLHRSASSPRWWEKRAAGW